MVAALVVDLEPAGFGLCEFRCGLATFPCRAQVRCWQHEDYTMRAPHTNGRGVEEACWQRSGEGAAVARSGCLSTSTDKGERPREGQELVVYLVYHYLLTIRCDGQICRMSALREAGNRLLCRDQLAFIHPMPMCADLRVHASMSNTRQTCLPPSRTPKTPRYSTNAVSAKSHNPQECPCQRSIMRICQEAQLMKASTYVVNRPPCP